MIHICLEHNWNNLSSLLGFGGLQPPANEHGNKPSDVCNLLTGNGPRQLQGDVEEGRKGAAASAGPCSLLQYPTDITARAADESLERIVTIASSSFGTAGDRHAWLPGAISQGDICLLHLQGHRATISMKIFTIR